MKYLKLFEDFKENDYGRFSEEGDKKFFKPQEPEEVENMNQEEECECGEEECPICNPKEEEEEENEHNWGDREEIVEKKMNAGFKAYLDKQKAKKAGKKDDKKDDKSCKGSKCDDKKDDKKEPKKGLTASQKKLPEALQKSILKKQK